ncbi:40S ribosomal protein S12, variant 2 [Clonorchis sinensis]|uniref:40S ribosomal protein S12, variant 2 n=1 Tax=Clonorchis sinensis TaxID=79923 RepID=A0A8T1MDD8_CLOSI|nr:40S ribosomal protein S12, variant 2 [Clonorchis sinensis]
MNLNELDLDSAVQQVLKNAAKCRGIFRGLHECSKAIEQRKAAYSCLIEALCREHEIPLIKVADNKKLGELAGLCKYDKEGKARKVVSASCIVVRDIGEESYGWKYLVEKYRIPVQARES